jgi:deoxyribose-phosphate aldolase
MTDKIKLVSALESTLLRPDTREAEIVELCHEAVELGVAAVCVNPCWVKTAARLLHATDVATVTVVGFPLGASLSQVKVQEIIAAKAYGAREVDAVINIGHVKSALWNSVESELKLLVETAHQCALTIKIIIECSLLTESEKRTAAELVHKAEADYIKTCTGFYGGAAVEDVIHLQAWTGPSVKVKASGGIRDTEQALALLNAGAHRLGTSQARQIAAP